MKIIAIANMKGGVGKTTLTVSLADGLASVFGIRVLVIDLDMQCNASQVVWGDAQPLPWLGDDNVKGFLQKWRSQNSYDCSNDIKKNVIKHDRYSQTAGWVSLFSGSNDLRMLERRWLSDINSYEKCVATIQASFNAILNRVRELYDIIVVDCPPGISILTEAILVKADMLLVPTAPTRFGIEGQNSYIDFVCELAPQRRPQVFLSMLSNKDVSKEFEKQIRDKAAEPKCKFDLLQAYFPYRVAFEDAMGYTPTKRFENKYGNMVDTVRFAAREIMKELGIDGNETG